MSHILCPEYENILCVCVLIMKMLGVKIILKRKRNRTGFSVQQLMTDG